MEELLTRPEAAKRLRVGLRTLDRRLATGELSCYRIGDGPRAPVRISEAQLQAYLDWHSPSGVQERAREVLARV